MIKYYPENILLIWIDLGSRRIRFSSHRIQIHRIQIQIYWIPIQIHWIQIQYARDRYLIS